ncbi:MAG: Uma2 family endonuclease [Deltaproteobacteria bacterium]|nr:Uma2 family endonuclease [Deltaproteobacteria bacterium]
MDPQEHTVWTYEDLVTVPPVRDGKKYEILHGELVVSPAPTFDHQEVLKRLFQAMAAQIEKRRLGTVHFTPIDVVLSKTRVVQPDLLVIGANQRNIITKRGLVGAPALVAEVVSRANASHDRVRKRRFYALAGVPEYWLVDPDSQEVEVLSLDGSLYRSAGWYASGDAIESPGFDIKIRVDDVFAIKSKTTTRKPRARKPRARRR